MASSLPRLRTGTRRKILSSALALSCLVGVAVAGCDFGCLQAACERDGLVVSATRSDGDPLADGTYDIELTADDATYTARCTLTQLDEGTCDLQSPNPDYDQDATLSVAGDDVPRDIRIEVKRSQANANSYDLTGPTAVSLAISLDGSPIAAADLSPTYEREEPNGPECGACEHSEYYVDLLPPTANN